MNIFLKSIYIYIYEKYTFKKYIYMKALVTTVSDSLEPYEL